MHCAHCRTQTRYFRYGELQRTVIHKNIDTNTAASFSSLPLHITCSQRERTSSSLPWPQWLYMTAERQVPKVEQLRVLQSPCLPSSCQCPGELAGGWFRHTAILSCSAHWDTEGSMCSSQHCICHLIATKTAELVLETARKVVFTVQSLRSQLCFNLQTKI